MLTLEMTPAVVGASPVLLSPVSPRIVKNFAFRRNLLDAMIREIPRHTEEETAEHGTVSSKSIERPLRGPKLDQVEDSFEERKSQPKVSEPAAGNPTPPKKLSRRNSHYFEIPLNRKTKKKETLPLQAEGSSARHIEELSPQPPI